MVGTSSDVAFADAYLKGVHNFDVKSFYQSAIKNASTVSPNPGTGRKGLAKSIFDGYTNTATGEGLSWSMDGYINDYGIANLAKSLSETAGKNDAAKLQYKTDAKYYLNRSQNYVNLFNRDKKFFIGRAPSGEWRANGEEFDAREWGGDYTETNAWNMAFHAPQDGQGLANLYGGKKGLAAKLDHFFSTPETALHAGKYGGVIHEMREARDVRMGMYGHSNQPSHHIMYMYNYAGQPWKTQEKVREALDRLYIGSEIGQGYAGDEDNGEMSAWQIFSALGFYPLKMGSPEYAIGAPLFKKATIQLENGKKIVIHAPKNSKKNKYVQGLKVNGKSYSKTFILHSDLAKGARLDFDMGPKPSKWGRGKKDAPASITQDSTDGSSLQPKPMGDLTDHQAGEASEAQGGKVEALFDNTSTTAENLNSKRPAIQYHFKNAKTVQMYSMTSAAGSSGDSDPQRSDPKSWVLKGSVDGKRWVELDKKENEHFTWRLQTRAFSVKQPGQYMYNKLEITENNGGGSTSLAELELLGKDLTSDFNEMNKSVDDFFQSGDLNGKLKSALEQDLSSAQLFYEKGLYKLSGSYMQKFINHLNQRDSQQYVSKEAIRKLDADAHALMSSLLQVVN